MNRSNTDSYKDYQKKYRSEHRTKVFLPSNFRDKILIELVDTSKEFDRKNINENEIILKNGELAIVEAVTQSRFLKLKIKFLASLLTL